MLVVFPYSAKDQDQAVRLAEWIQELGPYPEHRALIVRDHRCDLARTQAILMALTGSRFGTVETKNVTDDAYDRWPDSANVMFRNAAKHIEFSSKTPFLWMEPDAIPLKAGWLDAIEEEYLRIGKPFMGDRVEVADVPLHMSGVAVYPGVMSAHAGLAYLAQDIAWDVAASMQIVPQAHFTNLIEHSWKRDAVTKEYLNVTFESWEQVEREISKEAVIYHASKDGSVIRVLREHNLPVPVLAETMWTPQKSASEDLRTIGEARESISVATNESSPPPAAQNRPLGGQSIHDQPSPVQTCDIFIKSYPADYPWLKYCLRSVAKFIAGVRQVELVTPAPDDKEWWDVSLAMNLHVRKREEYGQDGYLSQQIFKLYADTFSDADLFLYIDSDTIFTRPVTPKTYFNFLSGKIAWMMTPWAKTETPWKPIVEKFLGQPVEFEFMRRHPTLVPRWLLVALRSFCASKHGVTLDKYVMSQPHRAFSEFNVLGAFAYAFHRDKFHWVNTEEVPEKEWPELTVRQEFSWGGLTDEIKAEFEKILSKSKPATTTETHANGDPIVAAMPQQVPWQSREQSTEEIRTIAERLKEFMGNSVYTRRVRDVLHETGVIQLPYRFKKRKGKWKRKAKV